MTPDIPEWITVALAAKITGKAPRTIYRWIDRDLLATREDTQGRLLVLSKSVGRVALDQKRGRPKGIPTRRR
ncbi:MAG: hypothetical protein J0H96_05745 [Microbacterium ginsengisoli]|nr:hypothetical protein [Microbacterium ginsengisoli]